MTIEVMDIQQQIQDHIYDNFLFGRDGLGSDDSFLEHGIVDSTGVLELVLFVEETFGVVVDDEEILPENFDSISSLAKYVTAKVNHRVELGL